MIVLCSVSAAAAAEPLCVSFNSVSVGFADSRPSVSVRRPLRNLSAVAINVNPAKLSALAAC